MGKYTEFIFGAELKKDTPKILIDALDYTINGEDKHPYYDNPSTLEEHEYNSHFVHRFNSVADIEKFCNEWEFHRLFWSSSYYFGAANPVGKFYWDKTSDSFHISTRADLKNGGAIEKFLEYVKPYIKSASGFPHHIYAYVHYEDDEFPTMYAMDGKYDVLDPAIREKYLKINAEWSERLESLYTTLAPEYAVSEAELNARGVSSNDVTYSDVWTWMGEYIVEKYKKHKPAVPNEAEVNLLLEEAISNVFDVNYKKYAKEPEKNISKYELERYKEIKREFAQLLTKRLTHE